MWPWYERCLDRAVQTNPEADLSELKGELLKGMAQLFQLPNALLVTKVETLADGKCLTVSFLAGDGLFDWGYDMERDLNAIAKFWGCTKQKIIGRKGWERLGKKYGYHLQTVELVKYEH